MNEQASKAETFDVFLCHNSVDKPAVREISQKLVKEGIKPWLDEADIIAGNFWHSAIGQQIETVKSAAVFVGQSGIGPWQHREIIALLDQFDRRGCPVIPVILPSEPSTPVVLPWSLASLNCVDFRTDSLPLQRFIWGITGQKPAKLANLPDSDKPAIMQEAAKRRLIAGTDKQTQSDNVIPETRLYPPLAEPPDSNNAAQLNVLRKRVSEYWVDGVLEHSLYNEVLISLGKRKIDRAIDAPWKYTVEVSDAMNSGPLDDRNVSTIFDATGLLLILGEPGSGKTTTLLDLARTLLERAKDDIKERIPIVVNLSSWKKKQSIEEWISGELSEKYRVPRKTARFWLWRGHLLPLMDGLDEVEIPMQPDCVTAINAFIEEFQPSRLVVCCRLNEYRWLPKRLKLNGAICIEPLSSEEVRDYLAAGGSKLATLREAIDSDAVLRELAQTPLMLSIMSIAFQGLDMNDFAKQKGDELEQRRKRIFHLYVEKMFLRKGTASPVFAKEQVIGWLSWLAGKMREHSQSVFLLDGLQPNWLNTRAEQVAYGTSAVLITLLIFWLSFAAFGGSIGWLAFWPFFMGGLALVCDGIAADRARSLWPTLTRVRTCIVLLDHIDLEQTVTWNWSQYWRNTIHNAIFGLVFGPIVGLIAGMKNGLFGGVIVGLFAGLSIPPISAGLSGFVDKVEETKRESPTQGIKLSLKNSMVSFLIVLLSTMLSVLLLSVASYRPIEGLSSVTMGISAGLLFGMIPALIFGLYQGGSAVIKHHALRLILWLSGHTPFKFIKFLDGCAKLIFLKKVGGGYIFIHRMLLDYFADLPQSTKGRDGRTRSIAP